MLAGIDTIAYAATLIFTILMTFSRAAIFLLPKVYQKLFEAMIYRYASVTWRNTGDCADRPYDVSSPLGAEVTSKRHGHGTA